MIKKVVYIPTGLVSIVFGGACVASAFLNPMLGDGERKRAAMAGAVGLIAGTACFSTAFRNKG